jgi:hypothetical protein
MNRDPDDEIENRAHDARQAAPRTPGQAKHFLLSSLVCCTGLGIALPACGSSHGSSDCAPSGTWVPSVTRSADPGDCPESVEPDLKSLDLNENEACGPASEEFHGTQISGIATCTYGGTVNLVASSTGIAGSASLSTTCWGSGAKSCTANYDVTFVRVGGDGGPPDAGASRVTDVDASTDVRQSAEVGRTCIPMCNGMCIGSYIHVGDDVFLVTGESNCPARCISTAARNGYAYCTASCSTDADCSSSTRAMRCLGECRAHPGTVEEMCWEQSDYDRANTWCGNGSPPSTDAQSRDDRNDTTSGDATSTDVTSPDSMVVDVGTERTVGEAALDDAADDGAAP